MKLPITRTKSNGAAMWDEGGYDGNTGRAVCITGPFGERLKPFFVHAGPKVRPNGKHALVPLFVGGYIVQVDMSEKHKSARLLQIDEINDKHVDVSVVASTMDGAQWDDGTPPPKLLLPALRAAQEQAGRHGSVTPTFVVQQ